MTEQQAAEVPSVRSSYLPQANRISPLIELLRRILHGTAAVPALAQKRVPFEDLFQRVLDPSGLKISRVSCLKVDVPTKVLADIFTDQPETTTFSMLNGGTVTVQAVHATGNLSARIVIILRPAQR